MSEVVQCNLAVVDRMKETHRRHGDIAQACKMIYEWFQKEYGDECPHQCQKLQCRSTCDWLEEYNAVAKNSTLDTMESELTEAKGKLDSMKKELESMKKETRQANHSFARLQKQLAHAQSVEADAAKALVCACCCEGTHETLRDWDRGWLAIAFGWCLLCSS